MVRAADRLAVIEVTGLFQKLDVSGKPAVSLSISDSIDDSSNSQSINDAFMCRVCWLIHSDAAELKEHEALHKVTDANSSIVETTKVWIKDWNVTINQARTRFAIQPINQSIKSINRLLSNLFDDYDQTKSQGQKHKKELQKKQQCYMCCTCWKMFEGKPKLRSHLKSAKHTVSAKKVKKEMDDLKVKKTETFNDKWNLRVLKTRRIMLETLGSMML